MFDCNLIVRPSDGIKIRHNEILCCECQKNTITFVIYTFDSNIFLYGVFMASFIHYFVAFLFPAVAFGAMTGWHEFAWALPFIAFILLPILDEIFPEQSVDFDKEHEQTRTRQWQFDIPLYLLVPLQWGLVYTLCVTVADMSLTDLNAHWLGLVFSLGICCGTFGINVAHELGHRNGRLPQLAAKTLLLSSLYMHFIIEHNFGHHRHVATKNDPASSRKNQTVYAFWLQSIPGSWKSAWEIENRRISKKDLSPFNNQMWHFVGVQSFLMMSIAVIFGGIALLSFVLSALIGILLLETINYLEHYGLERAETKRGRFERVQPHHSWNCNRSVGRLVLFELTRHSDHHAHAKRPYQILKHYEDAPQLPAGYPAMIVLALFPPLWFAIMNPTLDAHICAQSC